MTGYGPFVTIYCGVVAFVLGACMGSFLHCAAWRYLKGESVLSGRSHCDVCGHVLGFRDLIPLVSYALSRGKCRYCGEKLTSFHLWVEGVSACVFLSALLKFGLHWQCIQAMLLASILILVSLTDLYEYIIPDKFLLLGVVFWAIFLPFSDNWLYSLLQGLLGGPVVGGVLLLFVLLFEKIRGKEAMGGGDIKLLMFTGLFLGWQKNILCVFLACIIGIVMALATRRRGENDLENKLIPWGPSIAISAWITLLAGDWMLGAYMGLFR